jgi:hypothetical protein
MTHPIVRTVLRTALGTLLLVAVVRPLSGCGGDGQPSRGSISAPRKGGAVNASGEKVKPKAATGVNRRVKS